MVYTGSCFNQKYARNNVRLKRFLTVKQAVLIKKWDVIEKACLFEDMVRLQPPTPNADCCTSGQDQKPRAQTVVETDACGCPLLILDDISCTTFLINSPFEQRRNIPEFESEQQLQWTPLLYDSVSEGVILITNRTQRKGLSAWQYAQD